MLTRATLTRKIVGERDIVTEGGATLPTQPKEGWGCMEKKIG